MRSNQRGESAALVAARRAVEAAGDPLKAAFFPRFFKSGPGGYSEGDMFLGATVPRLRRIAKMYRGLSEEDLETLLASRWHEERFLALRILVDRFQKGDEKTRAGVVRFYLAHLDGVNNWDLVDTSAYAILGEWLVERPRTKLYALAKSKVMWRRRVAMVSCWAFIRRGECEDAFRIADLLFHDEHDLMHKAVGWMLREVGKKCGEAKLKVWLKTRYKTMSRTALRYAIEKFPEGERKRYLAGKV